MTQYVYLIECKNIYKIGVAGSVQNRLAQLQTGNPFPLVVMACFGFNNAEVVEKALHQRFEQNKTRGEWFLFEDKDISDFLHLCRGLGGQEAYFSNTTPLQEEIEDAEEVQDQIFEGYKLDYAAMFADGWKMAVQDGRGRYWTWKRQGELRRETIYGGAVKDLPYPIDEMRRVFGGDA